MEPRPASSGAEADLNGIDPLEPPHRGNGFGIVIEEEWVEVEEVAAVPERPAAPETQPAPEPPTGTDAAAGARRERAPAPEHKSGERARAPEAGSGGAAPGATDRPSRLGVRVEELQFIRLNDAATIPSRAHDSDAGLDLYAAEGARIGPGQRVSVGTGLAVAIPPGLAGIVLPRSGLALKHGVALVNSPGLIDPGYRGELRVLLLNTDSTAEFKVAPGDRIAQLLLMPIAIATPLEADSLDTTVRGESGFGSTG